LDFLNKKIGNFKKKEIKKQSSSFEILKTKKWKIGGKTRIFRKNIIKEKKNSSI
jgi:hypothetical protein